MQNQFFFVIHVFDPNKGAFELPLFINSTSSRKANRIAKLLLAKLQYVLQVVGRPSKPLRVFRGINQHRFDSYFNNLNAAIQNNRVVTINLPATWSSNPFTQGVQNPIGQSHVLARILVAGPHSPSYAL